MKNLHDIKPAIKLTNKQIASIWAHQVIKAKTNYILKDGSIGFGSSANYCAMDHTHDWREAGSPTIRTDNIEYV